MLRRYTGECPWNNTPKTIAIRYVCIPDSGSQQSQYKKMDFECPFGNECSVEYCPIFLNAPDYITE